MMIAMTLALAAADPGYAPVPGGLMDFRCSQLPSAPAEALEYRKAVLEAEKAGKPIPVAPPDLAARFTAWQAFIAKTDPLRLCKYDAANKALPPPTRHRIVFMGDSITEGWTGDVFGGDRINRGISGQTTQQMLGRFYADVIALRPAVVHILAGTNDVAGISGAANLEMVQNNLKAMIDLARAHGIRVVIGTVPPAKRFPWRPDVDPVPSIAALNDWIRSYARERGIEVIDYHAALTDGQGGLAAADSEDGVHPLPAGYLKMAAAAEKILGASW